MDTVLAAVTAILTTTAARWVQLTEHLPANLLIQAAGPGEWTARECLCHLLDTERQVFGPRLVAFMQGATAFAGYDQATDGADHQDQTLPQLAAAFAGRRAENLAALEAVSAADLERTAQHAEYGPVTLGEMLHEWAAHDLDHTTQAEDALMQPFIAGCGAWRPSFVSHDQAARGA